MSKRDNVIPFLRAAVGAPRLAWALARTSPRLAAAALDDRKRDAAKAALLRRTLTGFDAARARGDRERVRRRRGRPASPRRRRRARRMAPASGTRARARVGVARRVPRPGRQAPRLRRRARHRSRGRRGRAPHRRACKPERAGPEKVRRLEAWLGDRPAVRVGLRRQLR